MAYMPCDVGRHFNPGRNVNAYFARGSGSVMDRWNLRLCPGHWSEYQRDLAEFEVDPANTALSSFSANDTCLTCSEPVGEGGDQLFVTSYPTKQERKDYWARVHHDCNLPVGWSKA